MYNENKIGPKTDPWGTPYLKGENEDVWLFYLLFKIRDQNGSNNLIRHVKNIQIQWLNVSSEQKSE